MRNDTPDFASLHPGYATSNRSPPSPRHEALRAFLVERRKAAGLTQAVLAERLRIHRSYVADIERGQRRVDVVELFALAEAIGFDPGEAIERMKG